MRNQTRYCPVCKKRTTNRLAEVSHFRAHVRRGEMTEGEQDPDGPSFYIPGYERAFTYGVDVKRAWALQPIDEAIEWSLTKWLSWLKPIAPVGDA
jgi:hypothetical protein